jgi:hypothetical protein
VGAKGQVFDGRWRVEEQYPSCLECGNGVLVPLSDYGREGSSIMYKAWVCTNPSCGFHLRIDNGEVSIGKTIPVSNK